MATLAEQHARKSPHGMVRRCCCFGASHGACWSPARSPRRTAAHPLGITIDDKQLQLSLGEPASKSARQLWATARIARLTDRIKLFGEASALVDETILLSKQHNVVSEYTALLVTETDADYERQTSGRKWQRQLPPRVGDNLPSGPLPKDPFGFHSTPEPHEYAMIALALAMLFCARRRGWLNPSA